MDERPWEKAVVAARFRTLREEAMFTQARLARLIGIGRQALNKIENQHTMPHQATWDAFCEFEARHNQPEIVLPRRWL